MPSPQKTRRSRFSSRLSAIPENKPARTLKNPTLRLLPNGMRELNEEAPPGLRVVDNVPGHSPTKQVMVPAPKTGDALTLFMMDGLSNRLSRLEKSVDELKRVSEALNKDMATFKGKHVFVLNQHMLSSGGRAGSRRY